MAHHRNQQAVGRLSGDADMDAAIAVDHPGIVKIHDIGIFENIPYFTMDLIQGRTLRSASTAPATDSRTVSASAARPP